MSLWPSLTQARLEPFADVGLGHKVLGEWVKLGISMGTLIPGTLKRVEHWNII
jgi:hypothetical protein